MTISAGELNCYVTLQYATITRDSYGAETQTWTNGSSVWANIKPLQGREYYSDRANKVNAETTHKITIRYRTDVNPRMRIKYGNRLFEIESIINPDEGKYALIFMCQEVVV